MEEKLLPNLARNAGGFYVCHRLSKIGWNALPTTRNAKGPNVVIDSVDGERTWRLKVRSLSKRVPVPLGKDPNIDTDWVVVCNRLGTDSPGCYVMTPEEVRNLANRDKHGENHWLVSGQGLLVVARVCKSRIGGGFSVLGLALYCRVLRAG